MPSKFFGRPRSGFTPHHATLGLAILLLGACSTGTHTSGAWQQPRPTSLPYENVLVVAISSYRHARNATENAMVYYVSTHGTKAIASHHIEHEMGDEPLSRERVMAMADEADADAVLVTRMLHQDEVAGMTHGETYVKLGPQIEVVETEHTTQVWAGNYTVQHSPDLLMAKTDLFLESVVYDVAEDGRVVYVVSTEEKFKETGTTALEDVADEIAHAVAGQVRGAGLIR